MIESIDIYNDSRRKFRPSDSLFYCVVDAVKQNGVLNFPELTGSLIRSSRVIAFGIRDLVNDCPPDKAIFINQQIKLASAHLSRYIGWDVVNKFIVEETLETEKIKEWTNLQRK